MNLEIFIGLPARRIVTKAALLAYFDAEQARTVQAQVPLAQLTAHASRIGGRQTALARFLEDFDAGTDPNTSTSSPTERASTGLVCASALASAAHLVVPWEISKDAVRQAKRLARQHGLLFYCVNTEEWLNATRPCEPHRAGEVFTSERGRIAYLAGADAARLTDPNWFSEEASFGFALTPELSMQATAQADGYAVECRLGAPEHEFRAVTKDLLRVRETLELFYAGDAAAFSRLAFRPVPRGSRRAPD